MPTGCRVELSGHRAEVSLDGIAVLPQTGSFMHVSQFKPPM